MRTEGGGWLVQPTEQAHHVICEMFSTQANKDDKHLCGLSEKNRETRLFLQLQASQ